MKAVLQHIILLGHNHIWQDRLYKTALWITGIIIWAEIFLAIQAEYDDNIALVINAITHSFVALLFILALWIMKSRLLKSERKSTKVFLLLCSPASLLLFLFIFISLMGAYFKT